MSLPSNHDLHPAKPSKSGLIRDISSQLQEAKNQFSLVVDKALSEGPQTVTRHGRPAVVVVSVADYRKKSRSRRKSLLELFEPLRGVELEIERDRSLPRDPGL
jgi:prevent-host-death family protein